MQHVKGVPKEKRASTAVSVSIGVIWGQALLHHFNTSARPTTEAAAAIYEELEGRRGKPQTDI
eukprot:1924869-Pyramimonas_sp.AAC.1